MKESFSVEKGDIYVLICAVAFSVHILVIGHYSPKVNGVALSCFQFLICGIISAFLMMTIEKPQVSQIVSVWKPICYTGILSSGVAYTFQILAQKNTNPSVASLILSMESVIAAFAGWILLNEKMSMREIGGSSLVFLAILLTQINWKKKNANCVVN